MRRTLHENHFRNAQKTIEMKQPTFQLGDRVYFKNKQPGKMGFKMEAEIQDFCIEHDAHYLHIENQAMGKMRSCNVKDILHNHSLNSGNFTLNLAELGNK